MPSAAWSDDSWLQGASLSDKPFLKLLIPLPKSPMVSAIFPRPNSTRTTTATTSQCAIEPEPITLPPSSSLRCFYPLRRHTRGSRFAAGFVKPQTLGAAGCASAYLGVVDFDLSSTQVAVPGHQRDRRSLPPRSRGAVSPSLLESFGMHAKMACDASAGARLRTKLTSALIAVSIPVALMPFIGTFAETHVMTAPREDLRQVHRQALDYDQGHDPGAAARPPPGCDHAK